MTGYVFFSIRTSGPDLLTDKVLEVSAIRTNHEFTELARIAVSHATEPRSLSSADSDVGSVASHYTMMRAVAQKFAEWSPAVFVGCDAMQSSDRFLRRALYLTLHDPFLTTSSGSGRTDVIRMAEMAAVHAPGSIVIPRGQDRTPAYELEAIARANGVAGDRSGSSSCDVDLALGLCRLLADRAPHVVSSCTRFSQAPSVRHFLEENSVVLLTRRIGSRLDTRHVALLVTPDDASRECFVYDLAVDPIDLAALANETLEQRLQAAPKPVGLIRVSTCPILTDFDETMPIMGLDAEDIVRRAAYLSANPDFRARVIQLFRAIPKGQPPAEYVKPAFEPFSGPLDRDLAAAFHLIDLNDANDWGGKFANERLNEIADRLLLASKSGLI
ncbi:MULTISPECIES: hypothetical protein [unclassified Rhizobium]|uniref:hypothetical protein n=1 Tax=unclassified Rhizobium TaxID=2613769 RepID=UPI001C83F7DB|nr:MULTISPECIES: hypothetical protein [unclassified Rhizobium]MBX5167026.1 hypothetical protein [Rhizobium sp. NZLR4b]MBX5211173.1 hypothetical protein [Rhizobium sp. NZLR11]